MRAPMSIVIKKHEKSGLYVSLCGKVFQHLPEGSSDYPTVKGFKVHRLVAETHIRNDDLSKNCVCHRNDNPKDNNAFNLFWGTPRENSLDMHAKKRNEGRRFAELKREINKLKDASDKNLPLMLSLYTIADLIKKSKRETKRMLALSGYEATYHSRYYVKDVLPWIETKLDLDKKEVQKSDG